MYFQRSASPKIVYGPEDKVYMGFMLSYLVLPGVGMCAAASMTAIRKRGGKKTTNQTTGY